MPPQYKLDVKKDYIHVTVSGTFCLSTYRSIIEVTLSKCIINKKSIILLDLRTSQGNISTYERFYLAVFFSNLSREHPFTFKVKIAVVGFPPLIDPNRFGETVALNRGINIKVTNDIDEAINWLQVDQVS